MKFLDTQYPSIELLYGKVNINNSLKTAGAKSGYQQLISFNIPHQAIFYSKTILKKWEGYNTRYKILADYDLNLRLFEQDSIRKQFINKEVAIFCSTGLSNRTIDYLFFLKSWLILFRNMAYQRRTSGSPNIIFLLV